MSTGNLTGPADARCSTWAQFQGLDPIGSIGSYDGYLLVEWPLPWPRDIVTVPALAGVGDLARSHRLRLQLVVPAIGTTEDRILLYRRNGVGEPTGFTLQEGRVGPHDSVLAAANELLAHPAATDASVGDLLICAHGTRDRCCGSKGTRLAAWAGLHLSSEIRVWRTSHTGGHRFAPTSIVLPEGTAWAFLEEDVLKTVVRRDGSIGDIVGNYRGCSALATSSLQVLEREALRSLGWSLFDAERSGEDGKDGRSHLIVRTASGDHHTWEGSIRSVHRITLPTCGQAPSEADESEMEYEILDLVRR